MPVKAANTNLFLDLVDYKINLKSLLILFIFDLINIE